MSTTRSAAFLILSLAGCSAYADTLNVPADFPTIQAAIDAAQDGDEIVLAPGMYESPGIVIDRSLTVMIRSNDPDDPAVVSATVLTDQDDAGVVLASTDLGESIDLTMSGLTFRRGEVQNTERFIELLGVTSRFDRCRFEGNSDGNTAGTILFTDRGLSVDPSTSSCVECTFEGDVGAAIYVDTTTTWTNVSVRDGNGSISWDAPDGHTLRLSDTMFSNLTRSDRPRVEINHDVGPETAVLERVSFTDVPDIGLRATPSVTLRDVVIDRCASQLTEFAFVEADALNIDGLVLRDCDLSLAPSNIKWFIFATREIVARNMLLERNTGAELWIHATTDDQPGGAIIEDSVFRDNSATIAIVEAHQSVAYRRCTFERNEGGRSPVLIWGAGGQGGVIDAEILVEDCVFRENTGFEAGAISLAWSLRGQPVIVSNSEFLGNVGQLGGAVSTPQNRWRTPDGMEWVVFRNSRIVANRGGEGGSHFGGTRYESSTVVSNDGGTASLGIGNARVTDSVIVADTATPTLSDPSFDLDGLSQLTSSHSIIPPDAQGTNTTTLDPLFVRNPSDGGDGWGDDPSTPDIDESLNDDFGDLRLRPGSPAIDATDRFIIGSGETDLDGNARLRNDPGIPDAGFNGAVDIGAYEFQGTTCLPDVNQDGMVTPADYNAWILAFNNGSPLADQNRDGRVSPADFNAWILNFNNGCP